MTDVLRGQAAKKPTQIPQRGWWDILKRVVHDVIHDHVSVVSAGVAFFGLLAIFPAVTALISIAGLVLHPSDVAAQLDSLATMLPPDAASIIQDQVLKVTGGDEKATGLAAIFSFMLAYYGAVKGVKTLIEGMNVAYNEREKRSFVVLNLTAVALTLVLIVGVILATSVMLVLPVVLSFFPIPVGVEILLTAGRFLVATAMVIFGLSLLYRFAPSRRRPKWRWVSPGAVIACALWMIGTAGFSLYAQNFASYTETYGALGGVIILLTWLWLSAFIVLLGAELNAEMEHQTRTDTTVGHPRPEGARGAVKADTTPEGMRGPDADPDDVSRVGETA
ncbi:YihY/virulence factor BrkB family protein [Litorisediminicola beolgyonensis]|uniref:YihY/virulence factor BrkB family protein n=1 Tax=Litorisediminicola beolgyonensis TaxID=1173614 RepID=A0ABW3ZF19_9RHOB